MDNLNNTKESNDEIHIDVKENVKEVAQSKEDAMKSEEPASQNLESNNEIQEENVKEVAPSKEDAIKSIESASQSLESDLEKEMASLPNKDGNFTKIYEVSEKYRKAKEESYTPRVVSIGPLHHGKTHLQSMETVKLKCLTNLKNKLGISLKTLSEYATTEEGTVRSYYQDFKFDAEEFSKMILLDGIFIIVLISNYQCFSEGKALISNQNTWMLSDIKHDMLLLENQLPLFFVKGLLYILVPKPIVFKYKKNEDTTTDSYDTKYSFYEDLREYFQDVGITKRINSKSAYSYTYDEWHIVDLLLQLHLPSEFTISNSGKGRVEYTRSISELQGVGVRFCQPLDEGLFEIKFDEFTGELCIPQLTVNDTNETLFRNLIAFEQSRQEKCITSYVILMDSLLNTAEDVKLLVKKGIIVNLLGEDHLVADLFSNLHKEVTMDVKDFYYAKLCKKLNDRWRSSYFKWMFMLKNKYFSNPWSAISFVAATVVVALTIAQTVCAFKGLKK